MGTSSPFFSLLNMEEMELVASASTTSISSEELPRYPTPELIYRDGQPTCRSLEEILGPDQWSMFNLLEEEKRPDVSVLALLVKAEVPFTIELPKPPEIVPPKPKPLAKPPRKISPPPKPAPKMRPIKKAKVKFNDQVEPRRKKKAAAPAPPPSVDPNAVPLRRSSRQRSRSYFHKIDEFSSEKDENDEEKYDQMAADIPELRDYATQPDEQVRDELIIDPERASAIDNSDMFRFIGACDARFGADPYMSMIHLTKNAYDIKAALETLDLPETAFQKTIKKMSWDADDVCTFNKAMSIRKHYKAMSQLAKKMPSKTKNFGDVVTAYYALKKKLCSTGRNFQICENIVNQNIENLGFKYVRGKDCDNCNKRLWENSENAGGDSELCSVCGLYMDMFKAYRPNAVTAHSLYDLSKIIHQKSNSCKFKQLWRYDYGLVEPDLSALQHNLYCIRGQYLVSFFLGIKDKCKISKKARSILRVRQGLEPEQYFVFSTEKVLHRSVEETKSAFSVYAFDLQGYFDLNCLDVRPEFVMKHLRKRALSVPVEPFQALLNIQNSPPDPKKRKEEHVEAEAGVSSQPTRLGSLEAEFIESDGESKPESNQDVQMVDVQEKKPPSDLAENIEPSTATSSESRDELSPELGKMYDRPVVVPVQDNGNSSTASSQKSTASEGETAKESKTWKMNTGTAVATVNRAGDVCSRISTAKPRTNQKMEADEYDLYYLGKVNSRGSIEFEYGYDFYQVYEKRVAKTKPQFIGSEEKVAKKKLIDGKTPEDWLKESPLNKTCLEFINDFRACKRKFSNLADKYNVPLAVVKSFYILNNAGNGLQRIYAATDTKLRNRRGRKGRKVEIKIKKKKCKTINGDPETNENYLATLNDFC